MRGYQRYRRFPVVDYPEREWPSKQIEKAPTWVSVDLRDGNQALVDPMVVSEKMEMFRLLVKLGFKQIEIGFPAASQIEYDFLRELIDKDMIPDDVIVQVLSQCREDQIEKTFEAIKGCKQAVVHIYNSTSTLQRDVVFGKDKQAIIDIAVEGTKWVKERAEKFPGKIYFEYSPESFTGTELDFALEICTAVQDVWQPTPEDPIIFNLPSTVELTTPNVYADQIEWMSRHFKDRDSIILSIHPHNDRGCGVAATELALLAGAERVEGTLLGNGERTGNVDVLTVAYNMFSQGIDPELQDAINKGIAAMKKRKSKIWEVPYLPIDPADIGRVYEPVVRINSQSGKGGVAFVMSTYYGFKLPKGMHREFADVVQSMSEKQGEVPPDQIMDAFRSEYLYKNEPLHFRKLQVTDMSSDSKTDFDTKIRVVFTDHGKMEQVEAVGNGPLDAVLRGLSIKYGFNARILDYEEHALKSGSDSQAAAYIHLMDAETGRITYGVGVSSNITRASVRAIFSAVNRLQLGDKRPGISDSF